MEKRVINSGRFTINYGHITDKGLVRYENQDACGYFKNQAFEVFIICDGMGGQVGGKQASGLALETIKQFVKVSIEENPKRFLEQAVNTSNSAIRRNITEHPELTGMGTTIVILLITRKSRVIEIWRAHIGDSRLYRISDNNISQLTEDHSLVAELLKNDVISQEQAEDHPQRHLLTKALGMADEVIPDIASVHFSSGDRFLLCTDGITDQVPDDDIVKNSLLYTDPQLFAESLVNLANKQGGVDNATAIVLDFTTNTLKPLEN